MKPIRLAYVNVIMQCAVYGASFIALKMIIDANLPAFAIIFMRFSLGYLVLLSAKLCLSKRKAFHFFDFTAFSKEELIAGISTGLALFLAYMFQTFAGETTTPARIGLFTDLFIIFTPIASMINKRKFKIKPLIAAVIAFIGVLVVSNTFFGKMNFVIGDFLAVLCALSFTFHFLFVEKNTSQKFSIKPIDPMNFTLIQFLTVITIAFFATIYTTDYNKPVNIDINIIISLLFLGIPSTALTFFSQFSVQKIISASRISFLYSFESVFATFFSVVWGYDDFKLNLIIGTLMLVFATVLITIKYSQLKHMFKRRSKL
ncbi:MAG: DMT family transporter [Christensenellaceae bacterium]|jgi:drug/metabolite transporter (DMT)-like permease|nr:DMT family transporter [Christensenellaceae bacterium]